MSLFNIYKTLCDGLGLAPVNGSYVQALGDYFGVVDTPGKRYEDEVLVAAMANGSGSIGSRIESPDGNSYVETTNQSVYVTTDGDIQILNPSGQTLIQTASSKILMDDVSLEISNSIGNMNIFSEGDLVYTGNSAVSFDSLGSIAFTSKGGLVFSDSTTNFVQLVMTLPTTDIGLATGQLYTQTATELGGSGTQKVICIK